MTRRPPTTGHIRMKRPRQSARDRLLLAALVLAIVGGAGSLLWTVRRIQASAAPAAGDRAADVTDIQAYATVIPVGGEGWVGELPRDWIGDPAQMRAVCDRTLARLHPSPTQTLTIVGPAGLPLVECGGGVR